RRRRNRAAYHRRDILTMRRLDGNRCDADRPRRRVRVLHVDEGAVVGDECIRGARRRIGRDDAGCSWALCREKRHYAVCLWRPVCASFLGTRSVGTASATLPWIGWYCGKSAVIVYPGFDVDREPFTGRTSTGNGVFVVCNANI